MPTPAFHRDMTATLQNMASRHRQAGRAELARLAVNAARAYRLTLPLQAITGA